MEEQGEEELSTWSGLQEDQNVEGRRGSWAVRLQLATSSAAASSVAMPTRRRPAGIWVVFF